ncbi:MAG: DUF4384 domain-containing protein [Deltaproteobacteria bacterium]|jgi:hypothetical protein|nr:DUF4384 domain-containing protein [Deltaproteobacteria bacterium]
MTTYPRVFLLAFLIIWCGMLLDPHQILQAESAGETDGEKIVFQWAFCAQHKADAGQQPIVITRDTTLKSGDQIKFFVKLEPSVYLYLIYRSSQGDISVLFPYRFEQLDDPSSLSGKHYIPRGDRWLELDDHTGEEKYYLLAAADRLLDLEALINQYESADKAKKSGLSGKITTEIRNLRKRHLKFKTYAEKPVTIIGYLRGTEKSSTPSTRDIADFAVEISTTTFFSRTYTIDHQQE